MQRLQGKGVRFIVDAEGGLLLEALSYRPFLIKPNIDELSEVIGYTPENDDELISCAKKLKEMGAVNVLISLGADGALLLDEYSVIRRIAAPAIEPKSTVGAGDSMIAGFLAGLSQGYGYALRLGVASGSASAASYGLADLSEVNKLMEVVK
jgi:1-phosphofructokinase